ncbi:class I SAM-dependent methyltransferase [Micromonospora sp. DT229]|uniref:class I SAM-dependent methyltransferase n=1 Tax=Micromonospora sp. DT229 TaxID=3393430 RepID=UPI003CEC872B
MQYGVEHAELYDIDFPDRGKNLRAEAETVARLIHHHRPQASSVLDVACGTGTHLEVLRETFDHVEGVEYAPAMRKIAERRLPGVTIHPDDMREFRLGHTFDAVVCLGNAIACTASVAELRIAIERMVDHMKPGGVLIVEPFWFPENFIEGYVRGHLAVEEQRVVARITHSRREGDRAHLEIKFVIAEPSGIRDVREVLDIALFTHAEYVDAITRTGCSAELVPGLALDRGRPNAPGLYLGIRP